ncbi:MAG: DUF1906 domain-containing protein [Pyrinomonadaceae bacterium]|nr:DUF1906 domain-containing protein [Pyrinomonadaceae bacterium]MBP6213477.1 DUF1906 domain-containing protein [Pyrinomonadaceae bacterium]
MKTKLAVLSLLTIVLLASGVRAGDAPFFTFGSSQSVADSGQTVESSDNALIKGIDKSNGFAVVFTGRSLYASADRGSNWEQVDLPLGLTESIAGVKLRSDRSIDVVIASRASLILYLATTVDRGATWTRTPIGIDAQDLAEADLTDIGIDNGSGRLHIRIRLTSSSNFDRFAVYEFDYNRADWRMIEDRSDLKSESKEAKQGAKFDRLKRIAGLADGENVVDATANGELLLTQSGICYGHKTGCVQETKVRLASGADVTPVNVKEAASVERERAQQATATPTFALPPGGSTRISLNRGFDQCNAPSVSQLLAWWNASPYYDVNIYFSGRNRACSAQPNLTVAWIDQVTAMGWGLIPTVVGYQSPCTTSATTVKLSYDPVVSESQGRGEADIAVAAAINLGLTAGSILYYDMEQYSETVSTPGCRVATTAFLKGWTDRIKELNYKSGVYGSPTNAVNDWIGIPEPSRMEAVWLARWDLVMNVWTYNSPSPVVPTNVWNNHQRIKQWQNPHNETWGGVTINIDGNIADGPVAGLAIPKNRNADFDGDLKSDVSVFRPDIGAWYAMNSSSGTVTGLIFGSPTDTPAPGDFDGDGKTDFAVFRPSEGTWHWLSKSGIYTSKAFGSNGDVPVPADYNGDGKADYAVFRPSTSTWYIANSDSLNTITYSQFGQAGDKPARADYDGDGKADIAVFRPNGANGAEWWVQKSTGGLFATQFGSATDNAAPADYTGDGKADIAFWQPSTGFWYILRSEDYSYYAFPFGSTGDIPAPGDFDGDGKSDASVFRPSNGVWYMLRSQAGFSAVQFGQAGDRPVENAYLPQ